jgi:hypothetical protein
MRRFSLIRVAFCLCVVLCLQTDAWCEGKPEVRTVAPAPTITVTSVEVRDHHFRLDYRVENHSKLDIWICDAMALGEPSFEAVASEDGRTLTIRKRIGLPWELFRDALRTRYVRLKAERSLSGSLVIPLPARSQPIVSSQGFPKSSEHVQHIVLEIGYYKGDLLAKILDALYGLELLTFEEINEYRRSSNAEALFETDPAAPIAKSELLLQTAVDTPPLSYETDPDRRHSAPDLRRCNRIEITYEPSAFEYFYSYEGLRSESKLSHAELSRLRSRRKVVVDNDAEVKEFTAQVGKGVYQGITAGPAKAHVTCYDGKDRVAALDVYRDCFLTEAGEPFSFRDAKYPGKFRSLAVKNVESGRRGAGK